MLNKILDITFIFMLFTIGLLAFPITNNPHNLNVDNIQMDDACRFCHIPNTTLTNDIANIYIADSSLICLGCHDGIIAKDRAINFPGAGGYHASNGADLRKGHPISIEYREGYAGLKLKSTPIQNWNDASVINDLLRDGKIECVSCHEPHNAIYERYLRHKQGSAICMSCHNK